MARNTGSSLVIIIFSIIGIAAFLFAVFTLPWGLLVIFGALLRSNNPYCHGTLFVIASALAFGLTHYCNDVVQRTRRES